MAVRSQRSTRLPSPVCRNRPHHLLFSSSTGARSCTMRACLASGCLLLKHNRHGPSKTEMSCLLWKTNRGTGVLCRYTPVLSIHLTGLVLQDLDGADSQTGARQSGKTPRSCHSWRRFSHTLSPPRYGHKCPRILLEGVEQQIEQCCWVHRTVWLSLKQRPPFN